VNAFIKMHVMYNAQHILLIVKCRITSGYIRNIAVNAFIKMHVMYNAQHKLLIVKCRITSGYILQMYLNHTMEHVLDRGH